MSDDKPVSPKGRRYVLKNLNYRKRKLIDQDKAKDRAYFDIRKANYSKSLDASVTSSVDFAEESPRKGHKPPVYVSHVRKSPRNPKVETMPLNNSSQRKNENGLTPRDEYMVTKLYDRQIISLKPSDVRYTHDTIPAQFHDGRTLISTMKDLLYERVEIRLGDGDVPPIEVMQTEETEGGKSGKMWYVVNGNRRLYVFRRLEKCGALQEMQVVTRKYDAIEMDKHFLTRNHGRTVTVTNDAGLSEKIVKEVAKWKEWKAKQPKQKGVKGGKGGKEGGKDAKGGAQKGGAKGGAKSGAKGGAKGATKGGAKGGSKGGAKGGAKGGKDDGKDDEAKSMHFKCLYQLPRVIVLDMFFLYS